MTESIGIIAGAGQFPALVAQEAAKQGSQVIVCGFQGHTDSARFQDTSITQHYQDFHLGQFSKIIAFFKHHKVQQLCFAGAISKPKALDFRPDFRAVKIIFSLKSKGDDALLRAIIRDLESEGFSIRHAADLVPSLRCPAGILTKTQPAPAAHADIAYGWPIGVNLGHHDIGQCLVIRESMVIAVECLEGTDLTLKRGAQLGGKGCTAIKMSKCKQDTRVDLPSIGLETIRTLIADNYSCLAIEAQNSLFFDRTEALALADAHKLAIIALDSDAVKKILQASKELADVLTR